MGVFEQKELIGKFISKVFWVSLLGIWAIWDVNAVRDYTIETVPNVRLTNRLNHVSNPDDILSPEHVAQINTLLNQLEDSLGIEVAVVAVESIGDHDAREFATELFNYWGIGKEAEDNGLLIQLITEPVQRSVVFETGYGIEGVLPDAICYRLQQQYMIPDLKAGNFSEGMLKGVDAVTRYLLESDYSIIGLENQEMDGEAILGIIFLFSIFVFFVVTLIDDYRRRIKRCPECGQKSLVCIKTNKIIKATYSQEGLDEKIYRCKKCGYTERREERTDRLHRDGGFSGGSFSGGGGDSWGGGSSGGGGSISRF